MDGISIITVFTIVAAVLAIMICSYFKVRSKSQSRFWISLLISQIAVALMEISNLLALRLALCVIAVISMIVCIVFMIKIIRERKTNQHSQ